MKSQTSLAWAVLLLLVVPAAGISAEPSDAGCPLAGTGASVATEELASGPQPGERVTGFFDFGGVKCGGAPDRYPVGAKLRYY